MKLFFTAILTFCVITTHASWVYMEHYPWVYHENQWKLASTEQLWVQDHAGNWDSFGDPDGNLPQIVRFKQSANSFTVTFVPPYFVHDGVEIYYKGFGSSEVILCEYRPYLNPGGSGPYIVESSPIPYQSDNPVLVILVTVKDGQDIGHMVKVFTP